MGLDTEVKKRARALDRTEWASIMGETKAKHKGPKCYRRERDRERERGELKVVVFVFVQCNYLTRSRPCNGSDDWSPASLR